jgi:hypothetical protein
MVRHYEDGRLPRMLAQSRAIIVQCRYRESLPSTFRSRIGRIRSRCLRRGVHFRSVEFSNGFVGDIIALARRDDSPTHNRHYPITAKLGEGGMGGAAWGRDTGKEGRRMKAMPCPQCHSMMELLAATVRVCPACGVLQFQQLNGRMQTRYPAVVKDTDEKGKADE